MMRMSGLFPAPFPIMLHLILPRTGYQLIISQSPFRKVLHEVFHGGFGIQAVWPGILGYVGRLGLR